MGPTVCLPIQSDDVDHTNLGQRRRQEAHFGSDEARILIGFSTVEERHLDPPGQVELAVQLRLDGLPVLGVPFGYLEIEPALTGVHVPARYRALKTIPHDTAHGVHRRMRPHQLVAALPVDHTVHRGSDRGEGSLKPVPHATGVLCHPHDVQAIVPDDEFAQIERLTSPTGVEHGPVEKDSAVVTIHLDDRGRHRSLIRLSRIDAVGHRSPFTVHPTLASGRAYGASSRSGAPT